MRVDRLGPHQADEVVTVLCNAFYDYPVMRYVLGPADPDYDRRLRSLIGFFVDARTRRDELVLGLDDENGNLAGVALVTLPGERPSPAALNARREELWQELGAAARQRYEGFGAAAGQFEIEAPHHHLNMIGVRRAHAGRGSGRVLLDAVRDLAAADPNSHGVTLSTEDPNNLALYLKFGYRVLGHARVSEALETWVFFHPVNFSNREAAGKPRGYHGVR